MPTLIRRKFDRNGYADEVRVEEADALASVVHLECVGAEHETTYCLQYAKHALRDALALVEQGRKSVAHSAEAEAHWDKYIRAIRDAQYELGL